MTTNMLKLKLNKQITVFEELVNNANLCIPVLRKFDGKVVNIKVKNALREVVSKYINVMNDGYMYDDHGVKQTGYNLYCNDRWFTDGTVTNGGCQNGGYIDRNELELVIIRTDNNRLDFSASESMINISIGRMINTISDLKKALQDIEKEQEHARMIQEEIKRYELSYHHSVRSLNITITNKY